MGETSSRNYTDAKDFRSQIHFVVVMVCDLPSLVIRLRELRLFANPEFAGVYNTNVILSMQSISQRHQNGLEGYRHHTQATSALSSEIQHLLMVFCEVPWSDRFEDR
jgi:hypothetical protein